MVTLQPACSKSRTLLMRRFVWALLACLSLPVVGYSAPGQILADTEANKAWWTPQGSPVTIFMADRGGEAQMVFDKFALASEPVTLDIRSDAKRYELRGAKGTFPLPLAPQERDRITISMSGERPTMHLNDRAIEDADGLIPKLLGGDEPTVTLCMADATRVAISALSATGQLMPITVVRRAAAVQQIPNFAIGAAKPKTKSDAMVMAARKALFRLRIQTPNQGVFLTTTAFMIDRQGFAVCRLHPLRDAINAWALLQGVAEPIPIELWSLRPQLDLALIRVDLGRLPVGYDVAWLPVVEKDPVQGNEVWALGFGPGAVPTVHAGAIAEIMPYTQLQPAQQTALPYDHLSHWLISTAEITLENSGGPLVNDKGELVGINTWVWPIPKTSSSSRSSSSRSSSGNKAVDDRVNYALNASHVKGMLDPKPEESISFDKARMLMGSRRIPHNALPGLEVNLSAYGHSGQLRLASTHFHRGTVCPLCAGEGQIVDENKLRQLMREEQQKQQQEKTSRQTPAGRFGRAASPANNKSDQQTPEELKEQALKDCPRCTGSGLQHAESVFNLGCNVVLALAAMDKGDPKNQDARVFMEERLFDLVELNPHELARTLNAQARRHLHATSLRQGTPVMLIGVADPKVKITEHGTSGVLVQMGEFGPNVVMVQPDVSSLKPDGIVLVGGLLGGYLDDPNGDPMPLIHRGFVMNIPDISQQDANNKNAPGANPNGQNPQERGASTQNRTDAWRRWMESRRGSSDRSGGSRGGGR